MSYEEEDICYIFGGYMSYEEDGHSHLELALGVETLENRIQAGKRLQPPCTKLPSPFKLSSNFSTGRCGCVVCVCVCVCV
jgi:hypothetical protein